MDDRTADNHPFNAMVAAFVFRVFQANGLLRRPEIAEAIRNASDRIPRRLIGDQRVASLLVLRAMIDNPHAQPQPPSGHARKTDHRSRAVGARA